MPPRTARPPVDGAAAGGRQQRPRRFTVSYKLQILERYDTLNRAGKTALLRAEGLRASQVSQWRAQVYAAARAALSGEPGRQPARRIHISDSQWADLEAIGAAQDPPMSPERVVRALCAVATGRDTRLPWQPKPDQQSQDTVC